MAEVSGITLTNVCTDTRRSYFGEIYWSHTQGKTRSDTDDKPAPEYDYKTLCVWRHNLPPQKEGEERSSKSHESGSNEDEDSTKTMSSTAANAVHDHVGDQTARQAADREDSGEKRESNLGHWYACGQFR